jgi:hypothetical protein
MPSAKAKRLCWRRRVAARGIDVNNIDFVINYDIPDEMEFPGRKGHCHCNRFIGYDNDENRQPVMWMVLPLGLVLDWED